MNKANIANLGRTVLDISNTYQIIHHCDCCKINAHNASLIPFMERMLIEYDQVVCKLEEENSKLKAKCEEYREEVLGLRQQSHLSSSMKDKPFQSSHNSTINFESRQQQSKQSREDIDMTEVDTLREETIQRQISGTTKQIEEPFRLKETKESKIKNVDKEKNRLRFDINQKAKHINKLETVMKDRAKEFEKELQQKDERISLLKNMLIQSSKATAQKAEEGEKMISSLFHLVENNKNIIYPASSDRKLDIIPYSYEKCTSEAAQYNRHHYSKELNGLPPKMLKNDFYTLYRIIDEFEIDLELNTMVIDSYVLDVDPEVMTQFSTFVMESESKVKEIKIELRNVQSIIKDRTEHLLDGIEKRSKSERSAQKALIKYVLELDKFKKREAETYNKDKKRAKIIELEVQVDYLKSRLSKRTKAFAETLETIEDMLSKRFKIDFSFNMNPEDM